MAGSRPPLTSLEAPPDRRRDRARTFYRGALVAMSRRRSRIVLDISSSTPSRFSRVNSVTHMREISGVTLRSMATGARCRL